MNWWAKKKKLFCPESLKISGRHCCKEHSFVRYGRDLARFELETFSMFPIDHYYSPGAIRIRSNPSSLCTIRRDSRCFYQMSGFLLELKIPHGLHGSCCKIAQSNESDPRGGCIVNSELHGCFFDSISARSKRSITHNSENNNITSFSSTLSHFTFAMVTRVFAV